MSRYCEHCGVLLVPYKVEKEDILFCPACGSVKSRKRENGREQILEK